MSVAIVLTGMRRNVRRSIGIGAGLLLSAAGGALWRWKRGRLADLSARSELVETDRVSSKSPGGVRGTPCWYFTEHRAATIRDSSWTGYMETMSKSSPPPDRAFSGRRLTITGPLRTRLPSSWPPRRHRRGTPDRRRYLLWGARSPSNLPLITLSGSRGCLGLGDHNRDRRSNVRHGNPILDPLLTSTPVLDIRSGLLAFPQPVRARSIHREHARRVLDAGG